MTPHGLEQVAAALRLMTGLKLDPVIGPDFAGASARASKRLGLDSLATLAQKLSEDSRLDDEFVAELTIGETYFFRDLPHFDFVRNHVLPARQAAGGGGTFRIWSAGCSTGEEAWSLAMVCRDLALPSFDVLATDLSVTALAKGTAGRYPPWSVIRSPSALASQWLTEQGGSYEVDTSLRSSVRFEYLNLAADTYPRVATGTSGLDLIFCRNVLIYLDSKTIAGVYQKLFDALAVGGCLLCGPSDPPPSALLGFQKVDSGMGYAYVRPGSAPSAPIAPAIIPREVVRRARPASVRLEAAPLAPALEQHPTPEVASLHAMALSNQGLHAQALERLSSALHHHPESVELRYLNASLLLGAGDLTGAAEELQRVLYLDPTLAMAHFALALTLQRLGRKPDAARAYRNCERLTACLPPPQLVPLSDGQGAGRLAHSARRQLKLLEGAE